MAKSYSEALEGIFTPETTVRSLLDNVRETLVSKYTDLEAAEKLAAQIEAENGDILKIILNIANTMAEVHNGAATKEDAMATVTPMVKTIKEKCVTLGLTDAFAPDNDISEVELDMLKQFITECRTLVEEHINALRDAEGSDLAGRAADLAHGADTEETEGEEAPEDDVEGAEESVLKLMMSGQTEALEGVFNNAKIHDEYMRSTEMKQAKEYMKQANKLKGTNLSAAIANAKKARGCYDKLIKRLEDDGRLTKTEVTREKNTLTGKDTYQTTSTSGYVYALSLIEDKIDEVDAWILKYSNKNEKKSIDELKKALKAERKDERKARRQRIKDKIAAAGHAVASAPGKVKDGVVGAAGTVKGAAVGAAGKVKGAGSAVAEKAKGIAARFARKSAKDGDVAGATEALMAYLAYATEGYYTPDSDDEAGLALEATIALECIDDFDYDI